jgi:hypothetical protein
MHNAWGKLVPMPLSGYTRPEIFSNVNKILTKMVDSKSERDLKQIAAQTGQGGYGF